MSAKARGSDPVRVDLGIKLIKTFAALQVEGSVQKAIVKEVFGEEKLIRDMSVADMRVLLDALGVAEQQNLDGGYEDAALCNQAN